MESVRCPCGKVIRPASMTTHLLSKKHKTYVENPTRLKICHEKRIVSFK